MGNWARSTSWRNDWEWASDLLQSLVVFLGLNNSVVWKFDVFSPCRVVFGLGFSEIVAPLWTDDIGDQAFWGLFTAMLFFIAVFGILLKIDNRKKPKDTV